MSNPENENSKGEREACGSLYGVGVGPGDPGLVTLAAVEMIRDASVLAYPVHKEGADSRAFETVRDHVDPATRLLPLLMPMTRDGEKLDQAHAEASRALAEAAADGTDVVYLALGDPLFYSTFGYLAARFPGRVEVVSGVSAMGAMAAALGRPLADGNTPLMVVTGKDDTGIAAALAADASLVIIKPRGLSPGSLRLLEDSGAFGRASAAVELGSDDEEIITNIDREGAGNLPYFAILWIGPAGR